MNVDKADLARHYIMEDTQAEGVPILERQWYYSLEIAPGQYTRGLDLKNVHLTRSALRNLDPSGLRCLDIGCMECLITLLLERRGASEIHAYDRFNLHERLEFLRDNLNTRFQYHYGFKLNELYERLQRVTDPCFDVVIFSGVLYHMLDPIAGLMTARRFLRNGGIIIIETYSMFSDDELLYFNAGGRYGMDDNFWLPSFACLDYMLRFCRLKPLDCFYFKSGPLATPQPCRVCVPCLAVSMPPDADDWMNLPQHKDVSEFIDWAQVEEAARPPLNYVRSNDAILRKDGSVNIVETAKRIGECPVTETATQVRLPIGAIY